MDTNTPLLAKTFLSFNFYLTTLNVVKNVKICVKRIHERNKNGASERKEKNKNVTAENWMGGSSIRQRRGV